MAALLLLADDPRLAFARIGPAFLSAPARRKNFIHAQRHCRAPAPASAQACAIAAGAVIGEHVEIGPRCRIGANTVIEDGVSIGADCRHRRQLQHQPCPDRRWREHLPPMSAIGGEGFGFVPGPKGPVRLSHVGRVVIGDQVEIGSNCAIDRGGLGDTVIGDMTALDNLVQIGHNVRIGKACVFAGQAGVAGSATIGDYVMVGGAVSISDHVTVGNGAKIAGKSGVMRDVGGGRNRGGLSRRCRSANGTARPRRWPNWRRRLKTKASTGPRLQANPERESAISNAAARFEPTRSAVSGNSAAHLSPTR